MYLRERLRHEPVARHRVEHAGLAEHQHEHDRGQARDRADLDALREPRPLRTERVDRRRNRRCDVELRERDDAGEDRGRRHVEDRADDERAQDADGHVLARILRFLSGSRDGIETDVGKEHDRRRANDTVHAELILDARRLGNERMPVVGIHEECTHRDEREDDRDLDGHDDVVDRGGLGHAQDQQHGDGHRDEYRRQIEQ